MEVASGDWVTPSLQLVRKLDEGGAGSVWLADHTGLGSDVAVKFVAAHLVDNPEALARFRDEAQSCARIKSPHVLKIFDCGIHEGTPYMVMELLDGEVLRDRLEREGVLPPQDVVILVTQLARGLASAHQLGIVHRDIKPENIFMLGDDDALFAKILDFGIARGLGKRLTRPGTILGTPGYMSREQVNHPGNVDQRADLWALAVVAYEALTGQEPFSGETLEEICIAVLRGVFEPPSHLNPTLTCEVDAWFARAFHTDINRRPSDAKAFAASFVDAMSFVNGVSVGSHDAVWHSSYPPPVSTRASHRAPQLTDGSIHPVTVTPVPPPPSDRRVTSVAAKTMSSATITKVSAKKAEAMAVGSCGARAVRGGDVGLPSNAACSCTRQCERECRVVARCARSGRA